MERAIIICDMPKATDFYTKFLRDYGVAWTITASDVKSAKEQMALNDFDLCVCHFPGTGAGVIKGILDIAGKNTTQVLLFAREEHLPDVLDAVYESGIIVLQRPINTAFFRSALLMSDAVGFRMKNAKDAIDRLEKKLREEKCVGRAKCLLIEHKGMSEQEAHKFIEKSAMDQRISRREVAEEVIDFYG